MTSTQAVEKWRLCLNQLDRSVQDICNTMQSGRLTPLGRLPRDHEILMLLREIQSIGNARPLPADGAADSLLLAIVQFAFKRLYDIPSGDKLHMEVYLAVLAIFSDISLKQQQQLDASVVTSPVKCSLTDWVMNAPAEHKFNREVTLGLI